MTERAVCFGPNESLVGVLSQPSLTAVSNGSTNLPAVVILNSGLVHHVGLARLAVNIARDLTKLGFIVLRFDLSGIGDSDVRRDHRPFHESAIHDTKLAMDWLSQHFNSKEFITAGICSGARVGYFTAQGDRRVTGTILINAPSYLDVDNDAMRRELERKALSHHAWRIAFSRSFWLQSWRKAFSGQVDIKYAFGACTRLWQKIFARALASSTNHEAHDLASGYRQLIGRGTRLLVIHSEADEGLDHLEVTIGEQMRQWHADKKISYEIIRGANHTFSLFWMQEHLRYLVYDWSSKLVRDYPKREEATDSHSYLG